MALSKIVQQGEEVKFKITINQQGFNMQTNDFKVKLTWGMLNKEITITKEQMVFNEMDEWFFMFDTSQMVGRVKAECSFYVPDSDYPDGYRTEVNRQFLCTVISYPYPKRLCVPVCGCGSQVKYERTEASDVEQLYSYLVDRNGRRFITSDNETILVIKEF